MLLDDAAKQFEFERLTTDVWLVVVNELATVVDVPATLSGVKGSRLIARTTNTSLSSGERFKSTDASAKVFAAGSSTENPIEITELLAFNPVGMSFVKQNQPINLHLSTGSPIFFEDSLANPQFLNRLDICQSSRRFRSSLCLTYIGNTEITTILITVDPFFSIYIYQKTN